jgi:Uri superfamily endonuclease
MVMMVNKEENDELLTRLPPLPGTYALVLRFSRRLEILVGRLGTLEVQPGIYVYVGSALGPGGLTARVGRHCRREKRLRWHVDYLCEASQVEQVWFATGKSRWECRWANVLQSLSGASVPMAGFGASDCRCLSHLHFFKMPPSLAMFRRKLNGPMIDRLRLAAAE